MEAVSHEAASSEEFCPPKAKKKKKKKKKEFSMGTTADTIKVRLLKPFVLKTDRVWQHSDDDEEDDDGDGDREMGAWGNGMYMYVHICLRYQKRALGFWQYIMTLCQKKIPFT